HVPRYGAHVLARHERHPRPACAHRARARRSLLTARVPRRAALVRVDPGADDRAPHDRTRAVMRMRQSLTLAIALTVAACARGDSGGAGGGAPSNELLIVGYDREPDTLNRFSTHILEDVQ